MKSMAVLILLALAAYMLTGLLPAHAPLMDLPARYEQMIGGHR